MKGRREYHSFRKADTGEKEYKAERKYYIRRGKSTYTA